MTKEWLAYSEAQKIYGLSKPTLRKLVKNGDITASRPSAKKVLLKKKSIDEYFERAAVDNGAEVDALFKKIAGV